MTTSQSFTLMLHSWEPSYQNLFGSVPEKNFEITQYGRQLFVYGANKFICSLLQLY